MADLYRKSALERISSPEQLDKALKVTSPMSWLALLGITLIIIVAVVWSIVGTISVTVTTQGIVSSPISTNAIYAQETGTVVSVRVRVGDEVHLGDELLIYRTGNNEMRTVYSDQVGSVSDLMVNNGDAISQGGELIRISPSSQGKQVVVCYVPLSQAKKLERGMKVQIFLDSVDSQSYGHMVARIINIDAYAASAIGMAHVLGTGNSLDNTFLANGPVVAVTCEFYPDSATASGFYWSNEKGAQVPVSNGSLVSAKIVTEEVAPITKLFLKIEELWGD